MLVDMRFRFHTLVIDECDQTLDVSRFFYFVNAGLVAVAAVVAVVAVGFAVRRFADIDVATMVAIHVVFVFISLFLLD